MDNVEIKRSKLKNLISKEQELRFLKATKDVEYTEEEMLEWLEKVAEKNWETIWEMDYDFKKYAEDIVSKKYPKHKEENIK